MKKHLLIAVVALVTLGASAANRKYMPKAQPSKEKRTIMATPGAFKNYAKKMEVLNAFYNVNTEVKKIGEISKVSRRANGEVEEPQLIPAYSEWTYFYSSIMGGFIPKIMHDEAQFLISDDGSKAYFAPFANLGYVEGVLDTEAENPFAEYGAEVYTFTADVIAKSTNKTTGETKDLSLEPCIIENYTPYRSGKKTFQAYYLKDDNELYFPSSVCLALFDVNSDNNEIFDEEYVTCMLDLVPQSVYNEYISKGTYTYKSYYTGSEESGECQIFLSGDLYCVKGADAAYSGAWVEYALDEDDPSIVFVSQNQFIGQFNFYNDESHTATHPGIIVTVGLLQSDGNLTDFNRGNDYASTYKITENPDETTTIANTDNTVYGDYVFEPEGYGGGMYDAVDQSITILYEPIETGIENVLVRKAQTSDANYNLAGQRVNSGYKGLVIKNGRKFMNK